MAKEQGITSLLGGRKAHRKWKSVSGWSQCSQGMFRCGWNEKRRELVLQLSGVVVLLTLTETKGTLKLLSENQWRPENSISFSGWNCLNLLLEYLGFSKWFSGRESAYNARATEDTGLIFWKKEWQSTPVFLPGESRGQGSLAGYSPWGRKESDTTEQWSAHTCILGPEEQGKEEDSVVFYPKPPRLLLSEYNSASWTPLASPFVMWS